MGSSFLCEFPILFLTAKLNLGHNFSQFIHGFKIWIFEKPELDFQIFPNWPKSLKIEIFVSLPSYFAKG